MIEALQYDFFVNALFASLLAAVSCGIIGTYIVTKRVVFISGGLSHASFGGIGIGYYLGINPILGAAVFSVLSALGIEYISKRITIREDSAIAILWAFGMAIGILFVYMTPGYTPNLMTYLFGSILTVTRTDIFLLTGLNLMLITFFLLFIHPIIFISFDEEFARSQRIPVALMKYALISLIALTIVFNIRVVGIILAISLLTIPSAISNLFTNSFIKIIFSSIITGLVGTVGGLVISYFMNVPSGPAIIFILVVFFLLARLARRLYLKK